MSCCDLVGNKFPRRAQAGSVVPVRCSGRDLSCCCSQLPGLSSANQTMRWRRFSQSERAALMTHRLPGRPAAPSVPHLDPPPNHDPPAGSPQVPPQSRPSMNGTGSNWEGLLGTLGAAGQGQSSSRAGRNTPPPSKINVRKEWGVLAGPEVTGWGFSCCWLRNSEVREKGVTPGWGPQGEHTRSGGGGTRLPGTPTHLLPQVEATPQFQEDQAQHKAPDPHHHLAMGGVWQQLWGSAGVRTHLNLSQIVQAPPSTLPFAPSSTRTP